MSLHVPPTATNLPEWVRKVATAINTLLTRQAFPPLDSAPANPVDGQSYFNNTTGKAQIWDGTNWQDLF